MITKSTEEKQAAKQCEKAAAWLRKIDLDSQLAVELDDKAADLNRDALKEG